MTDEVQYSGLSEAADLGKFRALRAAQSLPGGTHSCTGVSSTYRGVGPGWMKTIAVCSLAFYSRPGSGDHTLYIRKSCVLPSRDSGARAHGFQARSVVYSGRRVNSSRHVALIASDLRGASHTPRLLGAEARTP